MRENHYFDFCFSLLGLTIDAMNVVVADDEERVCALICALIDWDGLNLTLCGTAYDGISALSLIERVHPDLVITDIRMPGLDGLALIQQAKSIQQDLQFIVISGHKQFDYAQTAIKYGVAEYLLKPIKQQELDQTLRKMIKRHGQQQELKQNSMLLKQKILQDKQERRQLSFQKLIKEKDGSSLSLCFIPSDILRVLAVKIDVLEGSMGNEAGCILKDKVNELIIHEGNSCFTDSCVCLNEGIIYLLVSYEDKKEELFLKESNYLLTFLKTQAEIFPNVSFTIGVGIPVSDFSNLHLSLLSAQQAFEKRLIEGCLSLYVSKALEKEKVENPLVLKDFSTTFQSSCAQNSLDLLKKGTATLLYELMQEKPSPYAYLQQIHTVYEHVGEFLCAQVGKDEECLNLVERGAFLLTNATTLEALDSQFTRLMEHLFAFYQDRREKNLARPIVKAQMFIASHYGDELLSLESVSEVVNLNSSYFSALFKKNCKIGFSEYLVDIRITQAKKLLAESDRSISEIAQQVGYHDPKHFSKVFKKVCQIKPNEYRKLYG